MIEPYHHHAHRGWEGALRARFVPSAPKGPTSRRQSALVSMEEMIIVREGTVETLQNGKASRLGPGSIIFHSSNDLHNIRNVGPTPATYHVVQWRVPAAAK